MQIIKLFEAALDGDSEEELKEGMNPKNPSLQQRLESTERSLSILRQNLSQLPAQANELSATVQQLSLIQSELQSIVENLSQGRDELISVLNHELLTPLTLLQGSLQLLAARKFSSSSEKASFLLKVAFKQTDQLLCLVRELLAYQHLKSGQLRIVPQPIPAAELVKQAAQVIPLNGKQMGVILSLKPPGVGVWAAPDYTILVLSHLLSNAIKFSPIPSIVTLTATLIESSAIQSQTQDFDRQNSFNHHYFSSPGENDSTTSLFHLPASQFVLFQVKDRGIGIPPHQLEKIFDCFYQVNRADSRPYKGLGLGLALAHQIIQQQGGQLWAGSSLGVGSTFYFTLPVYSPAPNWWVEIHTNNPQCTYYFGPFETASEAQALQAGYLEDLRQEQAQIITAEIKQCQPQKLTLSA